MYVLKSVEEFRMPLYNILNRHLIISSNEGENR